LRRSSHCTEQGPDPACEARPNRNRGGPGSLDIDEASIVILAYCSLTARTASKHDLFFAAVINCKSLDHRPGSPAAHHGAHVV
jgi:hypothetical protein